MEIRKRGEVRREQAAAKAAEERTIPLFEGMRKLEDDPGLLVAGLRARGYDVPPFEAAEWVPAARVMVARFLEDGSEMVAPPPFLAQWKVEAPRPSTAPLESNLADLVGRLNLAGHSAITLPLVASWSPHRRREAAAYAQRMAERPEWLAALGGEELEAQRQSFASGNLEVDRGASARKTIPSAEQLVAAIGEEVSKVFEGVKLPTRARAASRSPSDDSSGKSPSDDVEPQAGGSVLSGLARPRAVSAEAVPEHFTVAKGKELYSPAQYHTFEVGPFSITRSPRPGQTLAAAMEEALAELEQLAQRAFDRALPEFARRLRASKEAVR